MIEDVLFILLFVLGPVGLGLSFIFAKDFYWRLKEGSDAFEGKESERDGRWHFWQNAFGIFMIVFGLFVLYGFLGA